MKRDQHPWPLLLFDNGLLCDQSVWTWVAEDLRDDFELQFSHHRDEEVPSQPFIAIGHSIGGIFAADRARRGSELCVGVVLVDASDPSQFKEGAPSFHAVLWLRHVLLREALRRLAVRSRVSDEWLQGTETLPTRVHQRTRSLLRGPSAWWWAYRDLCRVLRRSGLVDYTSLAAKYSVRFVVAGASRGDPTVAGVAGISRASSHVTDVIDGADHMSILTNREHATELGRIIRAVSSGLRS